MKLSGICFSLAVVLAATELVWGAPRVAQSQVVTFPVAGQVIVQAREEIGHDPSLVVLAKDSGKVLLTHTLTAEDDLLKPASDAADPPFLRFRVMSPECGGGPLILAIAVAPGGSDHGFWPVLIGEVKGKLAVLSPPGLLLAVQGGLFLGSLNARLGCGLAVWKFVWDEGAHYDQHPYEIEIYTWQNDQLIRQRKYQSKRKYLGNGAAALRELGINAQDQRIGILKLKRYLQ